jgi:hypothetical protein
MDEMFVLFKGNAENTLLMDMSEAIVVESVITHTVHARNCCNFLRYFDQFTHRRVCTCRLVLGESKYFDKLQRPYS